MKYIIDLPEETADEIALRGTFLNPRDKERLQNAFHKRQPLNEVLQKIRQKIDKHCSDNRDRNDGLYIAMKIIDKHIKEIEDMGDYPDEIPNQFDNLTGSMNL